MGTVQHNVLVVTGWYHSEEYCGTMKKVHSKAKELCGALVSELIKSPVNGYLSFFVAPDGNNDNWPESAGSDHKRRMICEYIEAMGGFPIIYVDLHFGELGTGIRSTNVYNDE